MSQTLSDGDQTDLYADDPLTSEEWTAKYQKKVDPDKELERTPNDSLEGNIVVNECYDCNDCSAWRLFMVFVSYSIWN